MSTITLPEDLEAWARAEVAAGRAESVEALVAEALRERREQIEAFRAELDEARASVARGEGRDGKEVLAQLRRRISELRASVAAAE